MLYGLNDTIYWTELDRWDYTLPESPKTPHYTLYTLLSLKNTFITLLILSFVQFLVIYAIKEYTSIAFKKEHHRTNKMIHVLENINYSTPFMDWDQGDFSLEVFKKRFQSLKIEMISTFAVNIIFTIIMMVPLWFCGMMITQNKSQSNPSFSVSQVMMRHSFLKKMILTKDGEDLSYENSMKVLTTATLGRVIIYTG